MSRLTRLRLWLRLVALAVKGMFGRAGVSDVIISEAEAIHRDLGHGHDPHLILPQHRTNLT